MSIQRAAVTVKCDGREGRCKNYLEIDLESRKHDAMLYHVDELDVASLVEKAGWEADWEPVNSKHYCPDHSEAVESQLSNILPFPSHEVKVGGWVDELGHLAARVQ